MMRSSDIIASGVPFSALKWGCKPMLHGRLARGVTSNGGFTVVENYEDIRQPVDAQTFGSCTFNAATQCVEWAISKLHGEVVSLDYDRLYRQYNEITYGDPDRDEGANLEDPWQLFKAINLIPVGIEIVRPQTVGEMCDRLRDGPLCIGLSVHDGYRPEALGANGEVDVSMDAWLMPYAQGHAMFCPSTNLKTNATTGRRVEFLIARQSWGPLGPDGSGLTAIPLDHYLRWTIDAPVSVNLAGSVEFKASRRWEEWAL